uniref:Uncharacterized protein n=1 Tax=Timema douglasi TaxID=61478 RepID=A0A7R8ZEZ2_TIMDO|nr:unnamed protein product [Timema douglasi]
MVSMIINKIFNLNYPHPPVLHLSMKKLRLN